MLKLYYSIWVDGLLRLKSRSSNNGNWKILTLFFMTIAMGLNLATILSLLQLHIFKKTVYSVNVKVFGIEKLDDFLSFFVLFWLGPLILNYVLILRKNKYVALFNIYPYRQGKRFTIYFIASVWIFALYGIFFSP
jgi:hypothetical protein